MAEVDPTNPKEVDHVYDRRQTVWRMFRWLLASIVILIIALVFSVQSLSDESQFLQGIVLTALAGAISSLLSFMGLIVKGLVDNLTRRLGED